MVYYEGARQAEGVLATPLLARFLGASAEDWAALLAAAAEAGFDEGRLPYSRPPLSFIWRIPIGAKGQ
jgi:hypothetical protein